MSSSEFEDYLARLVRLMPIDEAERQSIRDELRSHLEDRFDDLLAQKVPRDEALRRAINELGDAARLAAAFVSVTRIQRRRRIMRFSSATIVAAVLALLALTLFWPAAPAVGPAAMVPRMAPSAVQAQAPVQQKSETRSNKSEIEQKLDRPIEAEFVETPLGDVLKFLSDATEVQFHVNRRALEEAGAAVDTPVSISLKDVKASTLLRLVLNTAAADLDFVERDGFVLVSTVDDLDRATEVRVYNCRDLLSLTPPGSVGGETGGPPGMMPMGGGFGGGPGFGEGGGGMGGGVLPRGLQGLIQASIESDSWELNGGLGSVSEFNGLLVIKQSPRVHEKIDDLLEMLRKAADLDTNDK